MFVVDSFTKQLKLKMVLSDVSYTKLTRNTRDVENVEI